MQLYRFDIWDILSDYITMLMYTWNQILGPCNLALKSKGAISFAISFMNGIVISIHLGVFDYNGNTKYKMQKVRYNVFQGQLPQEIPTFELKINPLK